MDKYGLLPALVVLITACSGVAAEGGGTEPSDEVASEGVDSSTSRVATDGPGSEAGSADGSDGAEPTGAVDADLCRSGYAIDDSGDVGAHTSLAADGDTLYAGFVRGGHLYVASLEGGTWSIHGVDQTSNMTGRYNDIAAAMGRAHLSYWDWSRSAYMYATGSGTRWTIETVADVTADIGSLTAIALIDSATPSMAYADMSDRTLHVATRGADGWADVQVAASVAVSSPISMEADAGGALHLVYLSSATSSLQYVTNASGTWTSELVAEGSTPDAAIAVGSPSGSSGAPVHVAYYEVAENRVWHLTRVDGGDWSGEVIDATGNPGRDLDLALSLNETPRLIYLRYDSFTLEHAQRDKQGWEIVTLLRPTGRDGALTVDGSDRSHIVMPYGGALLHVCP